MKISYLVHCLSCRSRKFSVQIPWSFVGEKWQQGVHLYPPASFFTWVLCQWLSSGPHPPMWQWLGDRLRPLTKVSVLHTLPRTKKRNFSFFLGWQLWREKSTKFWGCCKFSFTLFTATHNGGSKTKKNHDWRYLLLH